MISTFSPKLDAGQAVSVAPVAFRDAMAQLGAAVNIVATDGLHGRAGFAASAVCSVTDAPPTLLVCLQRGSSAYQAVSGNGVLCVNTLASGHEGLSQLFGGKTPMDQRFAAAQWSRLATGSPVLRDAKVAFDCRIARTVQVGTHDVLFCEVVAIELAQPGAGGLFYADRRYRQLAS